MSEILQEGYAECIFEPRGDAGLEGYQLGFVYHFQLCRRDSVKAKGPAHYYRVWPCDGDYYECCGPVQFKQYFKERHDVFVNMKPRDKAENDPDTTT